MDAITFFLERYKAYQDYPSFLVDGLSDEQLRSSPDPSLNPILWLLWHTARSEDVGINRLLTDDTQVYHNGPWRSLLNAEPRRFGTGMTKDEVHSFCARIHPIELTAYRAAVKKKTIDVVTSLPPEKLDDIISEEFYRKVFTDEGVGGTAAGWLADIYSDSTKGWLLGHLGLTHNFYHIGQAATVRRLYGLENPW